MYLLDLKRNKIVKTDFLVRKKKLTTFYLRHKKGTEDLRILAVNRQTRMM